MISKPFKFVLGLLALALSASSFAFTGHDLIEWSKAYEANPASLKGTAFGAYVAGVIDAGDGVKFCLPKAFTYADAMRSVVPYSFQYPVMIPGKASTIIDEYLASQHPCKS